MTGEELKSDVVRQALVEYLAARCCANLNYPPDPWEVATGLRNYVNRRYAMMDERFKTDKVVWLTPRINAVYVLLEDMREAS